MSCSARGVCTAMLALFVPRCEVSDALSAHISRCILMEAGKDGMAQLLWHHRRGKPHPAATAFIGAQSPP